MHKTTIEQILRVLNSLRQHPGIIGRIHRNDEMLTGFSKEQLEHYRICGFSALANIEASLKAAGLDFSNIHACLDFASGYGRNTRVFQTKIPPARITAADINEEAVRFCHSEFGVEPLPSCPDFKKIVFPRRYDLIWVGSLLTHLPPEGGLELLKTLVRVLVNRGILIFSTTGEDGEAEFFKKLTADDLPHRGTYFFPYLSSDHYGIAFQRREHIEKMIPHYFGETLRLVRCSPLGWDGYQDVWAFQKAADDTNGQTSLGASAQVFSFKPASLLLPPKVSVTMVTYNHERFISKAIESVLEQITDFDYELVIGDDASTDGTKAIVQQYAEKYPKKIRAFFHPYNLGFFEKGLRGKRNLISTYRACRGKYIAFLDGDDYWTDPQKLQKQVDYLDQRPEFSVCCHPVGVVYSDGRLPFWPPIVGLSDKEEVSLEEILPLIHRKKGFEFPTAGMMIRSDLMRQHPPWFFRMLNHEVVIQCLLAEHGKMGLLKDCMAVTRKHGGGLSRLYETDPEYCMEKFLKFHLAFDRHFGYRYHSVIRKEIAEECRSLLFAPKERRKWGRTAWAFASFLFNEAHAFSARAQFQVRRSVSSLALPLSRFRCSR